MSSVLHVIFKEEASLETYCNEIMKQRNTGATILEEDIDSSKRGYVIKVPDSLVGSITLKTDDVEAVFEEEATPLGRTLISLPVYE